MKRIACAILFGLLLSTAPVAPVVAGSEPAAAADACGKIAAAADAPASVATVPNGLVANGLVAAACCKVCRKGKACGDSCISRAKTCWKGPGCACDGYAPAVPDQDPSL